VVPIQEASHCYVAKIWMQTSNYETVFTVIFPTEPDDIFALYKAFLI